MTCINCIRRFRMSSLYTKNLLQATCQNSQVFCICWGKERSRPVMKTKIRGQLGHPHLILHQVLQMGRKIINFNKFGWKNTSGSGFREMACLCFQICDGLKSVIWKRNYHVSIHRVFTVITFSLLL